jgi:hypothetical protein
VTFGTGMYDDKTVEVIHWKELWNGITYIVVYQYSKLE